MLKNTLKTLVISLIFAINTAAHATAGLVLKKPNQAIQSNALIFGTEPTFPPFEFIEKNQLKGLDIELAQALCQTLQTTCKFSKLPWDSLIPSLQQHKIDAIIGAMAITEERSKSLGFTTAYFSNSIIFVGPKPPQNTKPLSSCPMCLSGKTVGVQGGTALDAYLKQAYGKAIKIRRYPSQQHALLDLKTGRLDAVLGDTPLIQHWLNQGQKEQFATFGHAIKPNGLPIEYAIAVRKNNGALLKTLNQGIDHLKKNGRLKAIQLKYIGKLEP